MTQPETVSVTQGLERWPGYSEQSWAQRFAELDRRYDRLSRALPGAISTVASIAAEQAHTEGPISDEVVAQAKLNMWESILLTAMDANECAIQDGRLYFDGDCDMDALARAALSAMPSGLLAEAVEQWADKVQRQAECLIHYAEQSGEKAKPIPSIYHLQASHFVDLANEARAFIGGVK